MFCQFQQVLGYLYETNEKKYILFIGQILLNVIKFVCLLCKIVLNVYENANIRLGISIERC